MNNLALYTATNHVIEENFKQIKLLLLVIYMLVCYKLYQQSIAYKPFSSETVTGHNVELMTFNLPIILHLSTHSEDFELSYPYIYTVFLTF